MPEPADCYLIAIGWKEGRNDHDLNERSHAHSLANRQVIQALGGLSGSRLTSSAHRPVVAELEPEPACCAADLAVLVKAAAEARTNNDS